METQKLNTGNPIPVLGLGTFKVEDQDACAASVREALSLGYRLIDTASVYGNEAAVGKGIKESRVPRQDIFLTTKVWNDDQGYDGTLQACEASLKRLKTDYLDLYLVHWPGRVNLDTWKAMERLHREGVAKAIGVSNFKVHHLEKLLSSCQIVPALNQTELHPEYSQPALRAYCAEKGIALQGWGPLMQGKIFDIPEVASVAESLGRSVSQVALRWALQKGILCIPKSTKTERLKENADIFSWQIPPAQMAILDALEKDRKVGMDPDEVKF